MILVYLEQEIKMKFIIAVIGMVMFLEGLPYFVAPEKTKEIMLQIQEFEPSTLRGIGFVLIALGLLLTFLGHNS